MCKRMFLMFVVVLLSVGVMRAQTVTGTIVGTVVDSAGASVPNAQVTILNQDTGISRTAVTTDDGQFRVPQLSSGIYTVSAEAPGLSRTQVKDINVAVRRRVPGGPEAVGRCDDHGSPGERRGRDGEHRKCRCELR